MNGFSFEFIEVPKIGPSIEKVQFRPYIGLEDNFQIAVAKYLDLIGAFWFHPANERKVKLYEKKNGTKIPLEGILLKKKGVKPGVPDNIILDQMHGYAGFVIELKVDKNTPSREQLEFIENCKKRNYLVLISWSLDEVIYWIDWYYNIK